MEHLVSRENVDLWSLAVGFADILIAGLIAPILWYVFFAHLRANKRDRSAGARVVYMCLSSMVVAFFFGKGITWVDVAISRGYYVGNIANEPVLQLLFSLMFMLVAVTGLASFIENRFKPATITAPNPDMTGTFLSRRDVEEVVEHAHSIVAEANELDRKVRLLLEERDRIRQG